MDVYEWDIHSPTLPQAEEAQDDDHNNHDTDDVEYATHGISSFHSHTRTIIEPDPLAPKPCCERVYTL